MSDGGSSGRWRAGRVYLLPCVLLIAVFLPGMNQGFWRVDNPLYAAISKYAYESGSLWTLMSGGQFYFNKPPLAFWGHGLALWLFGAELWAARLPSLFVAMVTVLLSVDSVRRLTGDRAAMASGIVLVLTMEFFRAMHSISLDLWLAMAITGAAWCVVRGLVSGRGLAWGAAAGLFIGAGLMIKPMIALAALVFFAVWLGVLRERRGVAGLVIAALVGASVALPWHLSMVMLHGDAFTAEYFGSQIMDRVTTDAHGSSVWWKYARALGETYWPWAVSFVLGALLLRGDRLEKREQRAVLLGVVFSIGWVAMLSLSHDKAGRYLIPIYPFASWVSGVWIARVFAEDKKADRALNWAMVAAPVIGSLLALFGPNPHGGVPPYWRELRAFLETRQDSEFVVTPRSRTLGAQVYLMRGVWPTIARWEGATGEDAGGREPGAGALMVTQRHGLMQARASDTVIFENAKFRVVRLATDWDGDYTLRAAASLDDDDE